MVVFKTIHRRISGIEFKLRLKEHAMKKRLLFWLLTILVLTICAAKAESVITSAEQLNSPGIKIGVSQGATAEPIVRKCLPQADIDYYTDNFIGYISVAQGKIDAYVYDHTQMQLAIDNGQTGVHLLEETLGDPVQIVVGISPASGIPDLENQVNRFIAEIRANGTLDDMFRRWVLEKNDKMPDIPVPDQSDIRLTVGTTATVPPYSYYEGTALNGYDIELAHRFAAWLGAELSFQVYDFAGIIPAAITGKVDVIMSNLQYLPDIADHFIFSEPLYEEKLGIMVRGDSPSPANADNKTDAGDLENLTVPSAKESPAISSGDNVPGAQADTVQDGHNPFWDSIRASFNRTFIRENRWQLFGTGIGTTMLITLLSILFGTVLGFLVFMLCRNGNLFANGMIRFFTWLITGTPMVVLLMILYYIIFGSTQINGIAVAVIGFTLTFGTSVLSLLRMGVGTIDAGQYEAAYALGHTNLNTFFKVILPQAIPHVLPAYQGEIVSLIKATAIVGYIAVQDLTKVGDIVRSRTYEAFFPLIAVTIIYFILEGLFILAVRRIRISIDPKKRSRDAILKGVALHEQN